MSRLDNFCMFCDLPYICRPSSKMRQNDIFFFLKCKLGTHTNKKNCKKKNSMCGTLGNMPPCLTLNLTYLGLYRTEKCPEPKFFFFFVDPLGVYKPPKKFFGSNQKYSCRSTIHILPLKNGQNHQTPLPPPRGV